MIYAIVFVISIVLAVLAIALGESFKQIVNAPFVRRFLTPSARPKFVNLRKSHYVIWNPDNPRDLEIRQVLHRTQPPTPVFDGIYRKPWGW